MYYVYTASVGDFLRPWIPFWYSCATDGTSSPHVAPAWCVCIYMYVCIYIYIHTYTHMCVWVCVLLSCDGRDFISAFCRCLVYFCFLNARYQMEFWYPCAKNEGHVLRISSPPYVNTDWCTLGSDYVHVYLHTHTQVCVCVCTHTHSLTHPPPPTRTHAHTHT